MFRVKEYKEEGFSLIELVVVVAVLGVLSAIAIPSFNCFQRKSKATAALTAIRQIQSECLTKQADEGSIGDFAQNDLDSYQIQSDGSNSCSGDTGSGLISAIPTDTNALPTFILSTNTNQLTYSFKGLTGVDFSQCLSLVCGKPEIESVFVPNCGPNCFEDNGVCVCARCQGYGPGLCGNPPCGDPMWNGTGYCSGQ